MQFELMNFVTNLKYMGIGMLGVFVVIGAVYLLNRGVNYLTERTKRDDAQDA